MGPGEEKTHCHYNSFLSGLIGKFMIMKKLPGIFLRIGLFAVIMTGPVYVFLANFAIFEPYIYPLHLLQGNVRKVSPDIIVGPYPDYSLLASLHERGVIIVVSLLDPDLIYEDSLIHKEKQLSSTLGMTDYDFPMDSSEPPGSALNTRAMAKIRILIEKHPHAKIYIHCYLGKHRVGDVVAMLKHDGESRGYIAGTAR